MRLNKFIALATGMSRRDADSVIEQGKVLVNNKEPSIGYQVTPADHVTLSGKRLTRPTHTTIILNKPVGYVVSRDGQGSKTIYDLLPEALHNLKPVGRLDKSSSGLLLMTSDGDLTQSLTHPSSKKQKVYEVAIKQPLQPLHHQMLVDFGVELEDGLSKFDEVSRANDKGTSWTVVMHEGRNRQIRRTFHALGYSVTKLHRTGFGSYTLGTLKSGEYKPTT